MNLLEARKLFVQHTGLYQLVGTKEVDGIKEPDYTVDNGADVYINEACRQLSEFMQIARLVKSKNFVLPAGATTLETPDLITVKQVRYALAEGGLMFPCLKSYDWVSQNILVAAIALVATACGPEFTCLGPIQQHTEQLPWGTPSPFSVEHVVGGTFDTPLDWTVLLGLIGQGKLYTSGAAFSATSNATIALDAGSYTFSVDVEDTNLGNSIGAALSGDADITVLPLTNNPGTNTLTHTFTVDSAGDYTLVISGDGPGAGLGIVIDNVSIKSSALEQGWNYDSDTWSFSGGIFTQLVQGSNADSIAYFSPDALLEGQKIKVDFTTTQLLRPTGLAVQFSLLTDGVISESGEVQILTAGGNPFAQVDIEYANFITISTVDAEGYYLWTGQVSAVSLVIEDPLSLTSERGLHFYPPSLTELNVQVDGWWYFPKLVSNADENYWLKHHGVLVVHSAQWIRDNVVLNFDATTTIGRLVLATRQQLANLDTKQEIAYHGEEI